MHKNDCRRSSWQIFAVDDAILFNFPANDRHRWIQSKGFLDTAFQVFHFGQVSLTDIGLEIGLKYFSLLLQNFVQFVWIFTKQVEGP